MPPFLDDILALLAPTRCAACDERSSGEPFCSHCELLLEPADEPFAVYEYGGPVADAIQRFKYDGRVELASPLGSRMAQETARWDGRVDAVVPVPLHWRRRRRRGYDQAALLARPVARALGVPCRVRGLRRVRNTPPQVELSHADRARNIEGAFSPHRLRGARRVLLIDDVRTTGATLRAATRALRQAGVDEVHPLVLATRVLRQSA